MKKRLGRGVYEKYEILEEKLGSGSFGEVYRAVEKFNQRHEKAIKIVDLNALKRKGIDCSDRIYNEISLHSELNNDNIVKMDNCFEEDDNRIYMVLEYCANKTLHKYVTEKKSDDDKACLPGFRVKSFMKQLLSGVAYLHRRHIVHRDLSANNILLTNDFQTVKICDFGLSKQLYDAKNGTKTFAGTPHFMAPEVSSGKEYGTETDMYSLGCIFYFMVKGEVKSLNPRKGRQHNHLVFQPADKTTVSNALEKIKRLVVSNWAFDLLEKLLCVNGTRRITVEAAQRHPFITGENQLSQNLAHDSGIGGASADRASVRTGTCQSSRSRGLEIYHRASSVQPIRACHSQNGLLPPSGRLPLSGAHASGAAGVAPCDRSNFGGSCCLHSRYDDDGNCIGCKRAKSQSRDVVLHDRPGGALDLGCKPCSGCCHSTASCLCPSKRVHCCHSREANLCSQCNQFRIPTLDNVPYLSGRREPTHRLPSPAVALPGTGSSKHRQPKKLNTRSIKRQYTIYYEKLQFRIWPDCAVVVTGPTGDHINIAADGSKMWKNGEEDLRCSYTNLADEDQKIYKLADYFIDRLKISSEERIRFEEDVGVFILKKSFDFKGFLFRVKKLDVPKEKLVNSSIASIINDLRNPNFAENEMNTIRTVLYTCQEYVKRIEAGQVVVSPIDDRGTTERALSRNLKSRQEVEDLLSPIEVNRPSRPRVKTKYLPEKEEPDEVKNRILRSSSPDKENQPPKAACSINSYPQDERSICELKPDTLYRLKYPDCVVQLVRDKGQTVIKFDDDGLKLMQSLTSKTKRYKNKSDTDWKVYKMDGSDPKNVVAKSRLLENILRRVKQYSAKNDS